ncbi:kelch repeat-containing protein, partial [Asanoa sp. NPDC050611]|uniref:kelch repeat-containing protein n=1 Tax=Asanoa sp. NPDC050611 TaxID=3157098 RepID=UPI0033D35B60
IGLEDGVERAERVLEDALHLPVIATQGPTPQTGTPHGVGLLDTALLYDPARDRWQQVRGRLPAPAYKLAVAPLPGGRALVVGGQTADDAAARLATTLVFDPRTGLFTDGPTMAEPRYKISDAVLALPDGRVAVAGGFGVEVYADGRFLPLARGAVERQYPALAALSDGALLVTGGYDDRTRVTRTALRVNSP